VTRQRIALYCVVGIAVYVVALVATLPATWVSRALERASSEKLLLRDPAGTIWSGSVRMYARERSGPPLELGDLRWSTAWTGLLTGKLVAEVAFGSAGKPAHVELSPFGVSVQALDVSLPARALGSFAPGLETFGPEGVLRVRTDSLRLDDESVLGLAEIEWRQVRFTRAPGLVLGSHVARLRGGGSKVDLELGTLDGPLRLSGKGTWDPKAGLAMAGSAEHGPQGPPALVEFLKAVCAGYRDNRCEFRFAL
jgi:general secretion pathway protein N